MRLLLSVAAVGVIAFSSIASLFRNSNYGIRRNLEVKHELAKVEQVIERLLVEDDQTMDIGNYSKALFAKIRRFPGNEWDFISPTGSLRALFSEGSNYVRIEYGLVGLEPICYSQYCKIEFRTGSSCQNGTEHKIGESYYNHTHHDEDPWESVGFYYGFKGRTMGSFSINVGYGYYQFIGHTVVVSSLGGEYIGCGVLTPVHTLERKGILV